MDLGRILAIASLLSLIAKVVYDYAEGKITQKALGDKNEEQDRKLKKLFEDADKHKEDAANYRLKFEVQMAEVRGELKGMKESHNEQFEQLREMFTRLETKIDRLEQRQLRD